MGLSQFLKCCGPEMYKVMFYVNCVAYMIWVVLQYLIFGELLKCYCYHWVKILGMRSGSNIANNFGGALTADSLGCGGCGER